MINETLMQLLKKPEFFDKFGLIIFTFISIISIYMLWTKKLPNKWVLWILLGVAVAGLFVDGTITLFLGRIA